MKFSELLSFATIIVAISFTDLFSQQDDPNIDNTFGLTRPVYQGTFERQVVTGTDGFDNFYLGIDFAEPHISANPNNPTEFFTAFNTNGTHYSHDGADWFFQSPNFGFNMQGDPVTAYDSLGNLYYENMYGTAGIEGCKVMRSTDNGVTWNASVTAISGNDKNWIAADQTSGPYGNFVYSTMTAGGGLGRFTRSTDFGATWQNTFSPTTQSLPGMMVAVGPNVSVGDIPGGAVYVVTNSGATFSPTYTFYLSSDGGLNFTFKSSQVFANYVGTNVGGRHSVENMRTRPYPFITADNSYGNFRGRLYLVYASNTPVGNGNKPDIFIRYSDDQAVSWSSAIMINDDPNSTFNHQWMPATWCDKETGRLYVKWFDTRNVPTSDSAEVYASYSDDGGITWVQNQNLSTSKFKIDCSTCGGGGTPRYQGDYDAIISNSVTSMSVWSDFRYGSFGSFVAYFPDFAMTVSSTSDTLLPTDIKEVILKVPAVKLYNNTVKFTATVSPTANFIFTFPDGDLLTSYPDSLRLQINTASVPAGEYVVSVYGAGPNGTPVHKRDISILVTPPVTKIIQPNGGEILYVGTNYPIKYEKIFVDTVKIEFSSDNGTIWTVIGTHSGNISGLSQFDWIVPNEISIQCLIRISDISNPFVVDVSDNSFSIEAAPFPNWRDQVSGIDTTILCVSIIDTLVAWAGAADGRVLKTIDGGNSWQTVSSNQAGDVTSIFGVSNLRAFLIVNSSTSARIRRTVNGGATWGTVYENTNPGAFINSVVMFDADNGYAVGNPLNGEWLLLKTTNTGTAWNQASVLLQSGTESGFPNSIDWFGINGWFGTNNGQAYRTIDAGLTWTSATTGLTNSKAISFADELLGMTGGDALNISIDGGQTWNQSSSQLQNDIEGSSVLRLPQGRWYFITGSEVYKTGDQGLSISLDYGQSEVYKHISMKIIQIDENFWICGYAVGLNGVISKYTELVTVTNSENETVQAPSEFILYQNYPNPFNPSTTIEYSLPVSSNVKIIIYNLLGQEINVLVNTDQNSGNHSVVWKAVDTDNNKVSSGIYFYKISAIGDDGTDFRQIRKMVLLK